MEKQQCKQRCLNSDGLCESCARKLRHQLNDLYDITNEVQNNLAAKNAHQELVTGSKEPPTPVSIDALSWIGPAAPGETITDPHHDQTGPLPLIATLTTWSQLIAEHRHITPPATTIPKTLNFLVIHADWCAQQSWAFDYATEIHHQWATGRRLAGIQPTREHIKIPCPRCDYITITRLIDEARYHCNEQAGGCGTWWTYDEWQNHTIRRLNHTAA